MIDVFNVENEIRCTLSIESQAKYPPTCELPDREDAVRALEIAEALGADGEDAAWFRRWREEIPEYVRHAPVTVENAAWFLGWHWVHAPNSPEDASVEEIVRAIRGAPGSFAEGD